MYDQLRDMRERGMTHTEMALALNTSQQTVSRKLAKMERSASNQKWKMLATR